MTTWYVCVIAGRERPVLSEAVGADIAHLASNPDDPLKVQQEIGLACWLVHVLWPEASFPALCSAMVGVRHHGRSGFEAAMRVLRVTDTKQKASLRKTFAPALRPASENVGALTIYRA